MNVNDKVVQDCVNRASKACNVSGEDYEDVLFDTLLAAGLKAVEIIEVMGMQEVENA